MKKTTFTLFFVLTILALSAQNWTPMAAGLLPDNTLIYSISAVGDNVVWAVASGAYSQPPIPASHRPQLLRTSDGGQTWTVLEIEEAQGALSFQIVAVDSLNAWITTQDYGTTATGRALYQTKDGGIEWTKKVTNGGAGVALNRFSDGQHWLAHNRQGISKSANNGVSWQNTTITGYQNDEYQLLYSGANMSATAGDTLWNGTSAGRIVRFTNFGQNSSFINAGLGTSAVINSIAFQDHLNGMLFYAISGFGITKIARTTDGGATWAPTPQQPGVAGWNAAAVPGAPLSYVLATNSGTANGKIAITQDFGETWSVETIGQRLNAVAFTSPLHGWVGAGSIVSSTTPALYKYTGTTLVDARTPVLPTEAIEVAPNPSNDFIRWTSPDNEPATVILSNTFGQPVFQGKVVDQQLDISHLPAGFYFLQVSEKGKVRVAKVVKR